MKLETKTNLSADELDDLSFDEYDEVINPKPEDSDFDVIVEQAISRRGFWGACLLSAAWPPSDSRPRR